MKKEIMFFSSLLFFFEFKFHFRKDPIFSFYLQGFAAIVPQVRLGLQ